MKKIISIFIVVILFGACSQKTLYSWDNYNSSSYSYLKNNDDKSISELKTTYENIINNQTGTRNAIPPGIYADYGFILLQMNQTEQGKKMLKNEIALYPESKVFIERILKLFEE